MTGSAQASAERIIQTRQASALQFERVAGRCGEERKGGKKGAFHREN